MKKTLLVLLMLISGCVDKGAQVETASVDVVSNLEEKGYTLYGFDEGYDSILGRRMLVGMRRENESQIRDAFILMYEKNQTMDHYVVELREEGAFTLLLAKGDDLGAFVKNEMDETEFQRRNMVTAVEFYEKLNKTRDSGIYIW